MKHSPTATPRPPKAGLRNLRPGDILAFYAGLQGWSHASAPALYLVGYFVVEWAGIAGEHPEEVVSQHCSQNFHVKHGVVYRAQRDRLVLVKGGQGSRLLSCARCISTMSVDSAGHPLKVLSPEAQEVFSDFGGKVSIQRSPTRWVPETHVERARSFLFGLP